MGSNSSKKNTVKKTHEETEKDAVIEENKCIKEYKTLKSILQTGSLAPDFTGKAVGTVEKIEPISLSKYKGSYIVLLFYPFLCPAELIAFSDHHGEFERQGCEIIGISTHSEFTVKAWMKMPREPGGLGKINMPLIADSTRSISRLYGLLKEDEGVCLRAAFIIDEKGVLRKIMYDLPLERDVSEVLKLVEAFRFTDENGQACPPGWKNRKKSTSKAMKSLLQAEKSLLKTN